MAQLFFLKSSATTLSPATPEAVDFLAKTKLGQWIEGQFKRPRNYLFHKKFFKLLQLGFEYWTPTGGVILPSERRLLDEYVNDLVKLSGEYHGAIFTTLANDCVFRVGQRRTADTALLKSFDAFRFWVTVQAGFYNEFVMPDGSISRVPKSIKFSSMDELEFDQLYKSVLNVLWNFILSKKFRTPAEAENTAAQLLEYA